jgi:hypothetical protein
MTVTGPALKLQVRNHDEVSEPYTAPAQVRRAGPGLASGLALAVRPAGLPAAPERQDSEHRARRAPLAAVGVVAPKGVARGPR